MKRLYVGNLPFSATKDDVRQEFEKFGGLQDVHLVMNRDTGQPRGFGFVTFFEDGDADKAIQALHGQPFGGRNLTVNVAEERQNRGGGGGGPRQAPQPQVFDQKPRGGNNGNGRGRDRGRGRRDHDSYE